METLKFGKGWTSTAIASTFSGTGNFFYTGSGASLIRVYSGTPMSVAQLNSLTMGATTGSKISDVDAIAVANGGQLLWVGTYYGQSATLLNNSVRTPDTPYASASASGLATWFMVLGSTQATSASIPAASTSYVRQCFIGTVSNTAGNGDLRLTDNNLVAGNTYRASAFTLVLPYETTF